MPTIQDIRQQYPQYNDMSDQQLADSLHGKHYSDISKEQFYQKIGFNSRPQQPQPSLGEDILTGMGRGGLNILSGLAKGGQGLINTPHNLISLGGKLSQAVDPFSSIRSAIDPYLPNQHPDFDAMLGIKNNDLAGKLTQGLAQYAPYTIGGAAAGTAKTLSELLGSLGVEGAAFGATQSDNPITGAAIGSATNMALPLAVKVTSGLGSSIKSALTKMAAPTIAEQSIKEFDLPGAVSNRDALDLAKQRYDKYTETEKNAWDNLSSIAKQLDKKIPTGEAPFPGKSTEIGFPQAQTGMGTTSNNNIVNSILSPGQKSIEQDSYALTNPSVIQNYSGPQQEFMPGMRTAANPATGEEGGIVNSTYNKYPFDNSSYINALGEKLKEINSQSNRQSGFARANKDSASLLTDYMNDTHGTFTDAIEHNKSLNKDYENEITPGKSLPFNTVNYAKNQIKNTIEANIDRHGLDDTLGIAWDNANKITQDKNQIFNEITSQKGSDQYSSFSQFLKRDTPYADKTNFINEYLPSGTKDSLGRMQQFSKIIGDENIAKSVIKNNYFDASKSASPSEFLTKYKNLSNEEKNYLFNESENKKIQMVDDLITKYPSAFKKNDSANHLVNLMASLGIGGGAWALHSGLAGAIAAPAAYGAAVGLKGLANSKPVSEYLANSLLKEKPDSKLPLLSAQLSKLLTSQAFNYSGNQ